MHLLFLFLKHEIRLIYSLSLHPLFVFLKHQRWPLLNLLQLLQHLRASVMTRVQSPVGASPQHLTVVNVQSLNPSVELEHEH